MANIINRQQTFSTNGTVTAAGLHNLIDTALVNSAIIKNQQEITTIGTADLLLIAPDSVDSSLAPRKATVQNLFDDALTSGTYLGLNLSGNFTYGTATGSVLSTSTATIGTLAVTTGTISNITIPSATLGTTTSTAATITSGTITTALIPTLTAGTTTGTAGIFTSGTVATLNSTTGTIGTLNSTTGTIGNLSTTLAGDFTITQGTGTIGTAKVTPTNLSQPFTSGTAVASTSGTAIDFTSIPSWAKRITVMFNGVSTNGASPVTVQLGKSGGVETTGYSGFGTMVAASGAASNIVLTTANTVGFNLSYNSDSNDSTDGNATIFNISGNVWVFTSSVTRQSTVLSFGNGTKTLGGTLDRIRITTVNGTDTFDAGSINIMYEG